MGRQNLERKRREQAQEDAYRRDVILRGQLRDTLLTALATGPDRTPCTRPSEQRGMTWCGWAY